MLAVQQPTCKPRQTEPMVKQFLDHLFLECGLAGSTVTAYQSDLAGLTVFLEARMVDWSEIAMDEIQQYMISLQERGLCVSSIARHLSTIKVFLRFLVAEKVLKRDIPSLIESPKRWHSIPNTARYAEIEALLCAPSPTDEFYLRDLALLEFLYATGMRVSEVADLTVGQVNLDLGYARCMGKGRKERIVPVGRKAIAALEEYLEVLRPRLLGHNHVDALMLSRTGRPLDRTNIWRLVRKYATLAGIERRISPHTLRHCFATHLLAGGADLRIVQELLGHADVTTTQIYTHVDETQLKHVHSMYHPRP